VRFVADAADADDVSITVELKLTSIPVLATAVPGATRKTT
jgi:hypothetical protein